MKITIRSGIRKILKGTIFFVRGEFSFCTDLEYCYSAFTALLFEFVPHGWEPKNDISCMSLTPDL